MKIWLLNTDEVLINSSSRQTKVKLHVNFKKNYELVSSVAVTNLEFLQFLSQFAKFKKKIPIF